MEKQWLAFRIYPVPKGTEYRTNDLLNKAVVEELFDYCQILEAVISRGGWRFLIEHYGHQELYKINQISGWFDCNNLESFIFEVEAHFDELPEY